MIGRYGPMKDTLFLEFVEFGTGTCDKYNDPHRKYLVFILILWMIKNAQYCNEGS